MEKFKVELSKPFVKDAKKLKKNKVAYSLVKKLIRQLSIDPFSSSLRTHKVRIPSLGEVWSSRLTGDLRVLWEFSSDNKLTIITLRLQGHNIVYK